MSSASEHAPLNSMIPGASPVPRVGWTAAAGAVVVTLAVLLVGLRTMGLSGLAGLADYSGVWLVAIPGMIVAAYLAWLNERLWVYAALAAHFVNFLTILEVGVTPGDMLFSAVVLAGLPVWLFKEVAIHRRRIVHTSFDVLLIGTVVATTIVSFVANRLHGGDLLWFAKEVAPTLDLLLYFPVRKVIRTRKDIVRVLVLFGIVALIIGVQGITTYKERLTRSLYAWQAASSRVFGNEPLSMAFLIGSAAITAYSRRFWVRFGGTLGMGLGLIFLVVSFSRGAFASGLVGVAVVMLFSRRRGMIRIAAGLAAMAVVTISGVFIVFPKIADSVSSQVSKRIGSLGRTTSDESFNLRVIEANTLIERYIPESPWIGYGAGTVYTWYSPTNHANYTATFIHNGYVRPFYKYGIPLGLLFLLFLLYPVGNALMLPLRPMGAFERGMLIACLAYLVAALVNNYVSDMFSHYAGPFNYIVCWTIIDYLDRQFRPGSRLEGPWAATTLPLPSRAAGS